MTGTTLGPVRQVGLVVADLGSAMEQWLQRRGIGPWTVYRSVRLQAHYLQRPVEVRMHVALAYDERGTEIELIQVLSPGPSPYQGADGAPLLGMNHLAWFCEDFDAQLEQAAQRQMEPVFLGGNEVMRVAYLRCSDEPAMLYELIEFNAWMQEALAARLAAARSWDGRSVILQEFDLGG